MRYTKAVLVVLGLALATHLDWHALRPTSHHLSLGLSCHWLLAIPVFALVAWYVHRAWSPRRTAASLAIVGAGCILGAVVEPAWEYWIEKASFEWAWGAARTMGVLQFVATGLIAYSLTLWLLARYVGGDARTS